MEEAKPKKLSTHDSQEQDRISKLPEEILHRILCSLSQKEAIQTCVLSKAWRYLGRTRPKIYFYYIRRGALESALDPILQACHDRNLRLDEFAVRFSSGDNLTLLLQKWIPSIIQNMRVKIFDLTNLMRDERRRPQLLQLPSLIIESHHIQNLSLHGCKFESSSSTTTTHEVLVYLQRLQKLRLNNVCIPEEILNSILSNCPFLEDVSLSGCQGFTRIKLSNNKPTKLSRFYFKGNRTRREVSIEIGDDHLQTLRSAEIKCCSLSLRLTGMKFLPCNLTTLSLHDVDIPEEILNNILSYCPSIEKVSLLQCKGFNRIKMLSNKPTNLEHFYFFGGRLGPGVSIEIGDNIQTLRSIEIRRCLFSVSHNKPLECARLTRLILTDVQLLSESFWCNLHSLKELKLDQCSSIKEFKLSSRSMKRLSINYVKTPFKATIDAPSMVSFIYEGTLPQSISFASTSNEWKSEINLGYYHELSFHELYGLLKALSQSEISLELDRIEIDRLWRQLDIGSTNDHDHIVGVSEEAKHQLHVAVEHLRIQRYINVQSSAGSFLNMLFNMFRPSFMYMNMDMLKDINNEHREMAELIFKERETGQSYIWQRGLEEVSLQVKYWYQSEWQVEEYTSLSFAEFSKEGAVGQLRIQLKWRE